MNRTRAKPETKPGIAAIDRFDVAVRTFEADLLVAGSYMPALATRLRLYADDFAEKYPDAVNGGRR